MSANPTYVLGAYLDDKLFDLNIRFYLKCGFKVRFLTAIFWQVEKVETVEASLDLGAQKLIGESLHNDSASIFWASRCKGRIKQNPITPMFS